MSFLDILTPASAKTYASWSVASGLDVYQNITVGDNSFTALAQIISANNTIVASLELQTKVNVLDWLNQAIKEADSDAKAIEQAGSAFVNSALADGVAWVTSALAEGENLVGSIATSLPGLDLGINLNLAKRPKKRSSSCGKTCEFYSDCTDGCRRCITYQGLKSGSERRCY